MPVEVQAGSWEVKIAEFLFSKADFQELVAYIWRGGMPGWQGNLRPDYVMAMKEAINASISPVFDDFEL